MNVFRTLTLTFVSLLALPCTHCRADGATQSSRVLRLPAQPYNYAETGFSPSRTGLRTQRDSRVAEEYDNTPEDNPITNHGATLGRVLFYDTQLSANGTTSCASCHQQRYAFTDPRKVSVGFAGEKVSRNSMSLVNLRYHPNGRMFWDERANSLEEQVLMPIENPVEMGHSIDRLVEQLSRDPIYPPLFKNAFGEAKITPPRIAKALAQFVRSIVSFDSRFDQGRSKVDSVLAPFPNFTDQENYGKEQFFGRGRCASCHLDDKLLKEQRNVATATYGLTSLAFPDRQSSFFLIRQATVNGIDSEDAQDQGVAKHTQAPDDVGRFKVPSLRNIEVTGPYMHDGRFHTLDQVIEHYNWSIRPHPNLDPRLSDAVSGIALPEREKVALTRFLLTLTDRKMLTDQRYSDPFVRDESTTAEAR